MVILVMIALAGLSAADHAGWLLYQGGDMTRYDGVQVRVVHVVDGDTLFVDLPDGREPFTRIRLWGMDTPETARRDAARPAEPLADEATAMTRELIGDNPVTLQLESHRARGHFGRVLAYVYLPDGRMLNEQLLLAGLAKADDRWPHQHLDRFALMQEQARKNHVGLWAKRKDEK